MSPPRKIVDHEDRPKPPSRQGKEASVQHWTEAPCGANYASPNDGEQLYFEGIERHRYETHPWIREAIESFELDGRDVLEVGCGVGTDHLSMARRGARMFGLDLTPRNLELTRRRFDLCGCSTQLTIGDAEALPYPGASFDFIYSFGVIHHTPDTRQAVSEFYRVLRPGGSCWVTVYNKDSLFFWWTVLAVNYGFRGGFRRRSLQEQLSCIEYPNTNDGVLVQLYRRREFASLFAPFRRVRSSIRHLLPIDVAGLDAVVPNPSRPRRVLDWLGTKMGWYVVVEATK